MKILVIDDKAEQREMAIKQLNAEHELTLASTFGEAAKLLKQNRFDVVLTDLMMPAETEWLSPIGQKFSGQMVDYGLVIALLALKNGVDKIAIVSNGQTEECNHHHHPIVNTLDLFEWENTVLENRLIIFCGARRCPRMDEEKLPGVEKPYYIKDWKTVLGVLMGECTLPSH